MGLIQNPKKGSMSFLFQIILDKTPHTFKTLSLQCEKVSIHEHGLPFYYFTINFGGGGGGEYGMEDLTLKYIHSIFVHFPVNNLLPD